MYRGEHTHKLLVKYWCVSTKQLANNKLSWCCEFNLISNELRYYVLYLFHSHALFRNKYGSSENHSKTAD